MGLRLGDIIQQVRLRHPAYGRDTVPNRVLVEAATEIQRRLALEATQLHPSYLVQTMTVALALNAANQPTVVGAGTSGGLPAQDDNGTLSYVEAQAGSLGAFDPSSAVLQFGPAVVNIAGSFTIAVLGAGRTLNADVGRWVHLVDGPGSGPAAYRQVVSNTAETWTFGQPLTYAAQDNVTIMELVAIDTEVSATQSVATATPPLQQQVGYLVKLNAAGVPYLDVTTPIVSTFTQGIPLPPNDKLLGINAWQGAPTQFSGPPGVAVLNGAYCWPVEIRNYASRYYGATSYGCGFSVYLQGQQLYLTGAIGNWVGINNLEIQYVPIPPAFDVTRDALDQVFLLPDAAYDVLVWSLRVEAATRALAQELIDAAWFSREEAKAEDAKMNWRKSVLRNAVGLRQTPRYR